MHQDVWPINPAAGKTPDGWPGWPDGKKFAVVLTHDVEGSVGLAKCDQLMRLEMDRGFRSSFNLIPEGDEYVVPVPLRETLVKNGFEVGVHDLYHNGKLLWTREDFVQSATQINRYIKEWGASGFRAGFMLRNLDWFHDLNIQYDASTFDTDPFEPQPEGVHTIFPFWVPRPLGESQISNLKSQIPGGFVELPYTLPQDSTLFLVLKQQNIDTWKRKIDWIAEHGGMVLLNTHPDYINFDEKSRTAYEYPISHYIELLDYIQKKYSGQYWHVLPREIAKQSKHHSEIVLKGDIAQGPQEAVGEMQTSTSNNAGFCPKMETSSQNGTRQKRICVIRHGRFPQDPRVRKEVDALIECGYQVDVLCLHQDASSPKLERSGGLTIIRIPIRHERKSVFHYFFEYGAAFAIFAAVFSWRHLWRRYDYVQVNTMPDLLVFCTVFAKFKKAKILLDVHEPTPELWLTKFGNQHGVIYNLQILIQQLALRYSDIVITVTTAMKDNLQKRVARGRPISVIPNVTELSFGKNVELSDNYNSDKFVIITHGLIEERYGHDLVIRAIKKISASIKNIHYEIIGEGEHVVALKELVNELNVSEFVTFRGFLPFSELVQRLRAANVGVISMKQSPYSELIDTNKMYEYMVLNIPVIHSKLPVVSQVFPSTAIEYFEPGNYSDLKEAILRLYANPQRRNELAANSGRIVQHLSWEILKRNYVDHFKE